MHFCDYHLHTNFSFDSQEDMEAMCKKAIEKEIREICFTEHVEFAIEGAVWPDFKAREEEIKKCRKLFENKLTIINGVETGQPQKELLKERNFFNEHQFDFVIGSVHMVGDAGYPSNYLFSKDNYHAYFKKYFAELKELAEKSNYDVIGHMTFPFRYVPEELCMSNSVEDFKDDYLELFEIIVNRGKGIEINTSGLRTGLKTTMPNLQILKWYKERGGKIVTIGSDGHSVRSAFSGLNIGYKVLLNAGFSEVSHYKKREVYFEKIY